MRGTVVEIKSFGFFFFFFKKGLPRLLQSNFFDSVVMYVGYVSKGCLISRDDSKSSAHTCRTEVSRATSCEVTRSGDGEVVALVVVVVLEGF